jgi:hypothetical protein
MIIKMINKIKEDMNKHLNEFEENTDKELIRIMMTMQDTEEEFIEAVDVLKKN